ncbi:MAG: hypothetical protein ACRD01_15000 [Terriglobales bacterium]
MRGGGEIGLALTLLATGAWGQAAAAPKVDSPLSTAQVVQRMVAMNAARTEALNAYTARRSYHVVYDGMGHKSATMQVRVSFQQPGPKVLTEVFETGSGMLRNHVLDPLLKQERRQADIAGHYGSSITPKNYRFTQLDFPRPGGPKDYVLKVEPHDSDSPDRFLFRGTIWVNPADFGIERIEGQLLRSPSWWVTHTHFNLHNQRIGDFYFPSSNHITSHVRFLGHAVLDISYDNFELTSIRAVSPFAGDGMRSLEPLQ